MFFSEIQSHKWAHKAAVTRTDLLSTWLLFHRCHGECPGLFLIPTVVFHPRYPQSPYKDRKKGTSRMFQLPKAEDVYCFCFFLQCLKLNPRCWVPAYCLLVTDKAQVHRRPAPVPCLYLAHLPTVPTEFLTDCFPSPFLAHFKPALPATIPSNRVTYASKSWTALPGFLFRGPSHLTTTVL